MKCSLATRRRIPASAARAERARSRPLSGLKEARELYDWADVIVVPLRPTPTLRALP